MVILLVRMWVEKMLKRMKLFPRYVILLVRMWVEKLISANVNGVFSCHPPCEDVSWKDSDTDAFNHFSVILLVRMWVEKSYSVAWPSRDIVILLVRMWVEKSPCHSPLLMHLSSSLWGCELKTFWLASETLIHTSSSLWGCELKSFQIFYICISLRHPPCEDVSWKSKAPTVLVSLSGHPPCEDVSWKMW